MLSVGVVSLLSSQDADSKGPSAKNRRVNINNNSTNKDISERTASKDQENTGMDTGSRAGGVLTLEY